jgi:hypothetical protein
MAESLWLSVNNIQRNRRRGSASGELKSSATVKAKPYRHVLRQSRMWNLQTGSTLAVTTLPI